MKFTLLILILFTKSCLSQETENNQETTKINNEISIEFQKPIEGFDIKILWKIKDSVPNNNCVIGPAVFKINRIIDNKTFEIEFNDYIINDTIYSEKIYNAYKNRKLPNIIQLEDCTDLILKDINFDNKNEIIIPSQIYDEETEKFYSNHKIYEFTNDIIIEINVYKLCLI